MPFLLLLLGVAAALALWLWRAQRGAAGAAQAADASAEVQSAVRRIGVKARAGRHPADCVDDARLAAAGMMAAVARMDGPLTVAQTNALRVECRAAFRCRQRDADDIAAYGRWLSDQSGEPEEALRRLGARLVKLASEEAQADLIRMLERVAAVENGVTPEQRQAIDRVRRRLATA